MEVLTEVVNIGSTAFLLLLYANYTLQLTLGAVNLYLHNRRRKYSDYRRYTKSKHMIPVSVIIPAFEEETVILNSVKNALALDYPEYEVVVVNDGSTDQTLAKLCEEFRLHKTEQKVKLSVKCQKIRTVYRSPHTPGLTVVDKDNGGSKADAINAGINVARYPIIVVTDADSLLERNALIRIVMPYMENSSVVAVGGNVKISGNCEMENGVLKKMKLPKTKLARFQVLEYSRSFFSTRLGLERIGAMPLISGAFGSFNKSVAIEIGGYNPDSLGEDMDLTFRIHEHMRNQKRPYKIEFLIDTVCWTQPPGSIKDLRSQRRRWASGLVTTLWSHKNMLMRPRYGLFGMFVFPFYVMFEFFGPVIEMAGYVIVTVAILFGAVDLWYLLLYVLVLMSFGSILSLLALALEEHSEVRYNTVKDTLILCLYALIDSFGYHQMVTFFKIEGMINFKKFSKWQVLKRTDMEDVH